MAAGAGYATIVILAQKALSTTRKRTYTSNKNAKKHSKNFIHEKSSEKYLVKAIYKLNKERSMAMTKREYLTELTNELFDMENKTIEELIQDKVYLEFEHDMEKIIKEDFAKLGCDTSYGEPTWLGSQLWMESNASQDFIDRLERKYRNGLQ